MNQHVAMEYFQSETSNYGNSSGFNKDEGTVSSIGSGSQQLFQNPPRSGSVPPPGFQQNAPPMEVEESPSLVDINPMGQIRATAREFVPTSFKPSPLPVLPPSGAEARVVSSMSSQPTTISDALHQPPPSDCIPDVSKPPEMLEPMTSLLNSLATDHVGTNHPPTTFAPSGMKADSPVPSAASSITGFSGLGDDHVASRIGSVMTFESAGSGGGGVQGTSLLDSYGVTPPVASPALGSGGIWGAAVGNPGSTLGNTPSLGGLPGLSSFGAFATGDQKDKPTGNNAFGNGRGDTWGTSGEGFGNGSSIW